MMNLIDSTKMGKQRENIVQLLLLSTLVIYTSAMSFLIHASRASHDHQGQPQKQYSASVSIVLSEIIKFLVCLVVEAWVFYKGLSQGYRQIEFKEDDARSQASPISSPTLSDSSIPDSPVLGHEMPVYKAVFNHINQKAIRPPSLLYSIPAILYVSQSMTQLLALSFLTPVLFQCVVQTKILSAAILSRIFLRSNLSKLKYFLLVILVVGVMVVAKNTDIASNKTGDNQNRFSIHRIPKADLKLIGIILAVLGGAFGSGAGLVMEVILKQNKDGGTLWSRNAHLAIFSIFFTAIIVLSESVRSGKWSLLDGFGLLAWLVVIIRALGGILISLVLKYTNTILKGVATGLAMTLSIILEIYFFNKPFNLPLILGSILVVLSSLGYMFHSIILGSRNTVEEGK